MADNRVKGGGAPPCTGVRPSGTRQNRGILLYLSVNPLILRGDFKIGAKKNYKTPGNLIVTSCDQASGISQVSVRSDGSLPNLLFAMAVG